MFVPIHIRIREGVKQPAAVRPHVAFDKIDAVVHMIMQFYNIEVMVAVHY